MSFNPDQPRDEKGRFASDGGGGSSVGKSSGSGPRPVTRGPVQKLSSGHTDATQKTVEQARKYFAKERTFGPKGVDYRNAQGKPLADPFKRRFGKPGTLGEFVRPSVSRMSYKPGVSVRVSEGSGLDTGRHGDIIHPPSESFIRQNEPGRYKPFDSTREVAIREHGTGKVFTMFKGRLVRHSS